MIPKQRILELLCPDLEEDAADNNFRFTLSTLSRVLEPNRGEGVSPYCIIRRRDSYGLDPSADVVVDTEEFEELIRQARSAQSSGLGGRLGALRPFRVALALYVDDFLPEQM